jgi:hypothetical protein
MMSSIAKREFRFAQILNWIDIHLTQTQPTNLPRPAEAIAYPKTQLQSQVLWTGYANLRLASHDRASLFDIPNEPIHEDVQTGIL